MKHEIRTPDGTATVRLTPKRAVRLHCLECQGFNAAEVNECGGDELLPGGSCKFFPFRLGRGRPSVKTIRRKCIWCMGGQPQLLKECGDNLCALWPYRQGHNPAMQGRDTSAARKSLKGALEGVYA